MPGTVIGGVGGGGMTWGERGYLVFEHQWPLRDSSGCLRQLQNAL